MKDRPWEGLVDGRLVDGRLVDGRLVNGRLWGGLFTNASFAFHGKVARCR